MPSTITGDDNFNTTNDPRLATAWVSWDPDGTIRDSYNVSSVTHDGTGFYTINFAVPMNNNNYVVTAAGPYFNFQLSDQSNMSEASVQIRVRSWDNVSSDVTRGFATIFGGK